MLSAELAALALGEFTAETLVDEIAQAVAEGFERDGINDLGNEGLLQEQTGFALGDASLAHVEEGSIVELAYGRAMRALHIVGIDLQQRLCVHAGIA